MSNAAIQAIGLSKIYNMGTSQVDALKDVDLTIQAGEFVALTGTSGSGKSTLMHLLGGLDIPTTGEVLIHGKSLYKCRERQLAAIRREQIGFVFQKFCLIQELSVRENIILPILLSSRKVDEAYIDEICQVLGLADRLHHMPSELSGGQQQRVAIARALANNPSIILCDEPTGNLDQHTSEEVMNLLHSVHETYHKTMVIVTHDRQIAEGADYILRLEDGQIVGRVS